VCVCVCVRTFVDEVGMRVIQTSALLPFLFYFCVTEPVVRLLPDDWGLHRVGGVARNGHRDRVPPQLTAGSCLVPITTKLIYLHTINSCHSALSRLFIIYSVIY
jgi:hypothetical protein